MPSTELKFEELVLKPYVHKNRRHPVYFVVVPFDDPSIVQMTESEDIILEVKSNTETGRLDIKSVHSSHPFHSAIHDPRTGSRFIPYKKTFTIKRKPAGRSFTE